MSLTDILSKPVGVRDRVMPRIICNDGASMSVQASATHACKPRNNRGPYTEVEVAFVVGAPVPKHWKEVTNPLDMYENHNRDGVNTSRHLYWEVYKNLKVTDLRKFIIEHGGERIENK